MDYIPPENIRREADYTPSDLNIFSDLRWALKHVGIENILFDGIATEWDGTVLVHVSERINAIGLLKIFVDANVLTSMGKFINRSVALHWSQSGGIWFLINEVTR
jgi:hypothetical protein